MDRHSSIHVGFGGCQEDEVFVWHWDVGDSIEKEDWIVSVLFGGHYLGTVVLDLGTSYVVFKGAVDEDLAFDVDEDHRANHLFKL